MIQLDDFLDTHPGAGHLLRQEAVASADAVTTALACLEDTHADHADLTRSLVADPALAVSLLRSANSPYYGLARQVGTAELAAHMVGRATLRAELRRMLQRARAAPWNTNRDLQALREHAASVARNAFRISAALGVGPPREIALVGLFHNIGQILLYGSMPEAYSRLLKKTSETDIEKEERRCLGVDHILLGAWHLLGARIPFSLVDAVRWQVEPISADFAATPPAVVALARAVASGHLDPESNSALASALRVLGLDEARARSLFLNLKKPEVHS